MAFGCLVSISSFFVSRLPTLRFHTRFSSVIPLQGNTYSRFLSIWRCIERNNDPEKISCRLIYLLKRLNSAGLSLNINERLDKLYAVCMMKITYSEHATVTHIDQLPTLCTFVFDEVNRSSEGLTKKLNYFFRIFHSQSLTGWKVGGVFRSIEPPPPGLDHNRRSDGADRPSLVKKSQCNN